MPLIQLTKKIRTTLLVSGACSIIISSCSIVKHYPKNAPFIYENTIQINGKIDKDEKGTLKEALMGQIEDSALVISNSEIPWPKFPWIIPTPTINKPNVFDTVHIVQSMRNMKNLMSNKGYRNAFIRYDTVLKVKKDQQRMHIKYTVDAGNVYKIDSIAYNLNDSNLQQIAINNQNASLLKKGNPLDYAVVDQELNRLVSVYKNKGYYKITRDEIFIEADSSYRELIDPSIDPFEYFRRLAEIEQKRLKNPEVDLYLRQRVVNDSTRLQPYTVGKFTVYSDAPADGTVDFGDTTQQLVNGYKVISFNNTFNSPFLTHYIQLRPGELYSQENFSKTLNNFNRLDAWQNINIIQRSNDSAKTIDYFMRLTPAKKQYFSVDLEGSSVLNTNQLVLVGSGKVGLALNFRLRNRNIGKKAIQLENTLRTGIEFNNPTKILSGEVTLTNRFTIPWLLSPFSSRFENKFHGPRTIVSFDFSYVDRFQYYVLKSFNTFIGYEWKPKPQVTWQFRPANIELTRIVQDSLFQEAIKENPLLVYAYNNGLVIGTNAAYNRTFNAPGSRHLNMLRIYGEESGLLLGALFPSLTAKGKIFGDLFRFVRFDVDYRHYVNYKKSTLVFRAFAGYGYAFKTESRQTELTLPFFKSYFAGGPNSMRGWQIRKLGIGSSIVYDTLGLSQGRAGEFNDKYSDIRLETNLEYRFNLFRLFGFWMRGAVFTDVGNIWFRKNLKDTYPNAVFAFDKLYSEIAVDAGAGVRMDFTYFLLRFDLGYPLKDPRYGPSKANTTGFYSESQYGWFVNGVWNKPTLQFSIGYPF